MIWSSGEKCHKTSWGHIEEYSEPNRNNENIFSSADGLFFVILVNFDLVNVLNHAPVQSYSRTAKLAATKCQKFITIQTNDMWFVLFMLYEFIENAGYLIFGRQNIFLQLLYWLDYDKL